MKHFKNIIFVASEFIDDIGQNRALQQAIEIAKEHDAQLTLMDAVENLSGVAEMIINFVMPARRLQEFNLQQRRSELQQLVGEMDTQGVKVQVRVLMGNPSVEIAKAISEGGYDLLVKLVEAKFENQRVVGPNDLHFLRKTTCPMWLFNGSQSMGTKILAIINSNVSDADSIELSHNVLQTATALAQASKAELHIVQCWDAPGVSALYGMGKLSKDEMDGIHEYLRAKHEKTLDGLIGGMNFGDVKKQTHLLKGRPDFLVAALAKQESIDLVVMPTVSDVGTPGVLVDGTAEAVLSNLRCAALTIKPTFTAAPASAAPTEQDLEPVVRST